LAAPSRFARGNISIGSVGHGLLADVVLVYFQNRYRYSSLTKPIGQTASAVPLVPAIAGGDPAVLRNPITES